MFRNKFSIFIYAIVALAGIGLLSQLFTNPVNFLSNILLMLGIGLAIFSAIYFFFFRKRNTSNDMKKYKTAVRQSKSKYAAKNYNAIAGNAKKKPPTQVKRKATKRATHLRVIDGNKRKKRATF
ncbi:SA1362 family protein [Virgibacillus flavescens]|uniref:SA1362 family protein n=1 Tax=Virgibacillus flavescens TaxID=1611422 RepID=UPI003D358A66